jgi:hypothetical protein
MTSTRFWQEFKKNQQYYASIDNFDANLVEQLLDRLLVDLHFYCKGLFFEIGGHPEQDERELIITAEGKEEYFGKAKSLVDDAPTIEKWKFTALRPPQGPNFISDFEGGSLSPKNMWFLPMTNPRKPARIGLNVYLPDYKQLKNNPLLKSSVDRVVETIVGEEVFSCHLQVISIENLPKNIESQGIMEMYDLESYLQWKLASLR